MQETCKPVSAQQKQAHLSATLYRQDELARPLAAEFRTKNAQRSYDYGVGISVRFCFLGSLTAPVRWVHIAKYKRSKKVKVASARDRSSSLQGLPALVAGHLILVYLPEASSY